ncbi:MAG: HIT family protein [Blastocatellia bacterium]|nr:HIT family protein [Blastocatellia bacterium]
MAASNETCPFCDLQDRIILEGKLWVVIADAFPVNPGHTLIITRRHIASFRNISEQEAGELYQLVLTVTRKLDGIHQPDGYNFGINDGAEAGQTIFHVHLHVIPRYKDDVENPCGGVRNIKPALISY